MLAGGQGLPGQPFTNGYMAIQADGRSGLYLDGKGGAGGGVLIDDEGNVGIGTTEPAAKLEVADGQILAPAGDVSAPGFGFSGARHARLGAPAIPFGQEKIPLRVDLAHGPA